MKKNNSKRIFKAFVASASDCEELRKASIVAIEEVNKSLSAKNAAIEIYEWEENKRAEFIKSGERYQDKIFHEFGSICDIFIIFFWTKLGEGTKEEYNFFKNNFIEKNPNVLFLGCHYGKPMTHEVLEAHTTYYDLLAFLKMHDKDWAPLGRVKRAIRSKKEFSIELRTEIMKNLLLPKFKL
jgi:hypothetical protein